MEVISSPDTRNSSPKLVVRPILNAPEIDEYDKISVQQIVGTFEKKSELNAVMADVSSSTVASPISTNDSQVTIGSKMVTGNPLVANDDDLIEKEWVDKAKKIVAETQNNPFRRDEEVNKLQVDYLKKRFGRELGATE